MHEGTVARGESTPEEVFFPVGLQPVERNHAVLLRRRMERATRWDAGSHPWSVRHSWKRQAGSALSLVLQYCQIVSYK